MGETKVAAAAETKVYYSEAIKTMKELTKKEMLCLTETCLDYKKDWLAVWDLFTQGEFKWYKGMFPAEEIDPSEEEHGVTLAGKKDAAETKVAAAAETKVYYSEAMKTMKELTKKEMLCLTLFTIDDECVKHEYIRLA